MSSAPTPDEIWKDARWLAQAVDPRAGLVRLVEMSPQDYREASFLDDRMFERQRTSHLLKWDDVAGVAPANASRDARWIFHIGHVGSTLIARLLGELAGVLAIREPRALRDLVMSTPDQRTKYVRVCQQLYSRTFDDQEMALVKASSFVSDLAADLTGRSRALFMYATPRAYIEGILAGDNSRKELRALADWRGQRLQSRVSGLEDCNGSEAHLAAIAWACEFTALVAAERALPDGAVRWTDFDRMLDHMVSELKAIGGFFGFDASEEQIGAIVAGPLMRRYSKALEYEYSPELRRDLLREAGRHHRRSIDDALAMLERAAKGSPLLATALERAHSGS